MLLFLIIYLKFPIILLFFLSYSPAAHSIEHIFTFIHQLVPIVFWFRSNGWRYGLYVYWLILLIELCSFEYLTVIRLDPSTFILIFRSYQEDHRFSSTNDCNLVLATPSIDTGPSSTLSNPLSIHLIPLLCHLNSLSLHWDFLFNLNVY